ncbi:hypothetical protein SAMN05192568_10634 [Methylobacterium pseudosasicola]|uniref:Uncharacterized protein n=1 Tax=Methylobacterium pseudosasicola TaxID=582667 RepID=A0A1I4U4C5_9HYPH|nr:hypothetical protein SAMN05192568_10634 [Methylobacterium pseudosasicola]
MAAGVIATAGPVGIAVGIIAAGLAAWAVLNWDSVASAGNSALSAI